LWQISLKYVEIFSLLCHFCISDINSEKGASPQRINRTIDLGYGKVEELEDKIRREERDKNFLISFYCHQSEIRISMFHFHHL
jgi:hypothetical protein